MGLLDTNRNSITKEEEALLTSESMNHRNGHVKWLKNGCVGNGLATGVKKVEGCRTRNLTWSQRCRSAIRPFLPSTYAKLILPPVCYKVSCYCVYAFWFMIGLLVLRKTRSATDAVKYIKAHGHTVSLESIETSTEFTNLMHMLDAEFTKPPGILLLNQHALNMTFNFLCNTQIHGVHNRFVFVTLDSVARDVLKEYWPNVRQFYWPTASLYVSLRFMLQ